MKQEIARQGILPYGSFLSSTRPFGSPLGGFLLHFVPSFLVIVLPPSQGVFSFVLELEQYPAQILSLLLAIGLVRLRYQRPDLKRPFKQAPGLFGGSGPATDKASIDAAEGKPRPKEE